MKGLWQRPPIIISIFVLMAAIWRLPNLGGESFWFDEAVSYTAAQLPVSQILNNTIQSSHPPLYYLMLRGWLTLFPDTDGMLRVPGVFFSLLTVAAVYALAREVFRRHDLAAASTALAAMSPFIQLYSHELRMYTQLMFWVTLTALAYLRARRLGAWRWWLVFGAAALAAQYTHLFAGFVLAAIGLHAVGLRRQRQEFWRTAVVLGLVWLLFLPWLSLMVGESQADVGSLRPLFQDRPADQSEIDYLKVMNVLVFLTVGPTNSIWFGAVAIFITLAYWIILVMERRKARTGEGLGMNPLPGWAVLMAVGMPLLVFYIRPFFLPERTMAAAVPFLLIFLTWGLIRWRSPLPWLWGATAVLMFIAAISYLFTDLGKPPYREVMAYVTSHADPDALVLHTSDGSYLPGLRYVDWPHHVVLAGDPDPRKPADVYRKLGGDVWTREQVMAYGRDLWLIVSLEHSVSWQNEQVAWFDSQFREIDQVEMEGVFILHYRRE